jgi:1,4-dihydroxy-2-naphthoate octaprenyltransferase
MRAPLRLLALQSLLGGAFIACLTMCGGVPAHAQTATSALPAPLEAAITRSRLPREAFALLVANVLYINQFPDVKADAACGKRTLVVRLGVLTARWGYLLLALSAYGWMIVMLWLGRLPLKTWPALLPVVASFIAARHLWRAASQVDRLRPAIQMTIAAANIHGLLLSLLLLS